VLLIFHGNRWLKNQQTSSQPVVEEKTAPSRAPAGVTHSKLYGVFLFMTTCSEATLCLANPHPEKPNNRIAVVQ